MALRHGMHEKSRQGVPSQNPQAGHHRNRFVGVLVAGLLRGLMESHQLQRMEHFLMTLGPLSFVHSFAVFERSGMESCASDALARAQGALLGGGRKGQVSLLTDDETMVDDLIPNQGSLQHFRKVKLAYLLLETMERALGLTYSVVVKLRSDVEFDLQRPAQVALDAPAAVAHLLHTATGTAHLQGDQNWVAPRQVAKRIAHVWTILDDLELMNRSLGGAPQLTTLAALHWRDVEGCWVNYTVFTRCMPFPTSWGSEGGWRRYVEGGLDVQAALAAAPSLRVSDACPWVTTAVPFQETGWNQAAEYMFGLALFAPLSLLSEEARKEIGDAPPLSRPGCVRFGLVYAGRKSGCPTGLSASTATEAGTRTHRSVGTELQGAPPLPPRRTVSNTSHWRCLRLNVPAWSGINPLHRIRCHVQGHVESKGEEDVSPNPFT